MQGIEDNSEKIYHSTFGDNDITFLYNKEILLGKK